MEFNALFRGICEQRYADQQICHAVASATRVNQGVGPWVLQQPLAKMTSGKMDDPVEASFEAWPPNSPNSGERFSNLALSLIGIKFVPAKLFQILRDQFANGSRIQKLEYLLTGIRLGFQHVHSETGEIAEQVKAVNAKLEGDRFREAVSVACEEAARAANDKKIEQMAAVLVGYLGPTPSAWAVPDEDIASMIRDIAQLNTAS
jgi:hypothetical protein